MGTALPLGITPRTTAALGSSGPLLSAIRTGTGPRSVFPGSGHILSPLKSNINKYKLLSDLLRNTESNDYNGEDHAVVTEELEFVLVNEPFQELNGKDAKDSCSDNSNKDWSNRHIHGSSADGVLDFHNAGRKNGRGAKNKGILYHVVLLHTEKHSGMLLGVEKDYMVEYSFVLGTPAILAASIVEIKDAVGGAAMNMSIGPILVGIITAGVFGVLAIKLLEWLVHKDKFQFFGYYCMILSIVVIALGIAEKV